MTNKTTEPAALAGIEPVAIEYCGRCDKATLPYDFNTTFYSAATVKRLVQERETLSVALEYEAAQLAASQTREQQLRGAMTAVSEYLIPRLANKVHSTGKNHILPILHKALSLPQDDTALRQWGAKLLREMADGYAHGAKDADKDSRVFLSEANARCAIHLHRKADELTEGKP